MIGRLQQRTAAARRFQFALRVQELQTELKLDDGQCVDRTREVGRSKRPLSDLLGQRVASGRLRLRGGLSDWSCS